MVLATTKNFETLVALRFFIGKSYLPFSQSRSDCVCYAGLAESTFYPAMQYVIGSWYKGDELAKRACIFHVSRRSSVPWSLETQRRCFVPDRGFDRPHLQRLFAGGT